MSVKRSGPSCAGVGGKPVSDGSGQALPAACGWTTSPLCEGNKDPTSCSATQRSFLGDTTSYRVEGRGLRSQSPHHSLQSPQMHPKAKSTSLTSESLQAPGLRVSRCRRGHVHRLLDACSSCMQGVPSHWAKSQDMTDTEVNHTSEKPATPS